MHIRNAPTKLMKDLGYHAGYKYAHDSADAFIPQEYLPDELRDAHFYTPGAFGFEREVAKRMAWWDGLRTRARGVGAADESVDEGDETDLAPPLGDEAPDVREGA
jgi:putative ATPase